MSARQMNNVNHLLIGGTATITTGGISSLNTGEIGIFDAGGTRLTEASATQGMDFFLALGGSSPLQRTPIIKGSSITSAAWASYSAPTEQLDYIGYNGTDGSIEVFDNNLYMVQVYVEDYLTSSHDGRYIKHFQYESDATASQSEIALGLASSAYFNWSREPKDVNGDPFMTFSAICNDAGAIIGTGAGTASVIKGSKVVTFSTDVDDATGATALAAGVFIRFGTTVTTPMYKIVSIDTANETITLDRPYGEATNSAVANNAIEQVTAALGAAADWGVALQGVDKPYSVGKEFHKKVRFTTNIKDFGSTTVTKDTAADEGLGALNAVSDLEWFTKGNQGEYFRMGEPTIHSYTSDVDASVAGGGYDFLSIKAERSDVVGFQGNVSPMEIQLATPATAPNYVLTGATDDITDVLEVIIYGAAGGELAHT